jgi:hypothetical protein
MCLQSGAQEPKHIEILNANSFPILNPSSWDFPKIASSNIITKTRKKKQLHKIIK